MLLGHYDPDCWAYPQHGVRTLKRSWANFVTGLANLSVDNYQSALCFFKSHSSLNIFKHLKNKIPIFNASTVIALKFFFVLYRQRVPLGFWSSLTVNTVIFSSSPLQERKEEKVPIAV